jgi:hypothetical protein
LGAPVSLTLIIIVLGGLSAPTGVTIPAERYLLKNRILFIGLENRLSLAGRPTQRGNGMSWSEAHREMILMSAADYCCLIG